MASAISVDAYLAALPDDRRAWMQTLRETIRAAAPEATEVITYNMPGFKTHGAYLVSYDAFKRHYSLFAGAAVVEAFREELRPYLRARSTIGFPIDTPVPIDLVTRIIKFRIAAIKADAGR